MAEVQHICEQIIGSYTTEKWKMAYGYSLAVAK